eukprot:jgi/Botrbrau1/1312/Bobra.0063s0028.1
MEEPGPWQERLFIFVFLCAMVLYLAKIAFDFRNNNLTLRRNADIDRGSETSDDSGSHRSD